MFATGKSLILLLKGEDQPNKREKYKVRDQDLPYFIIFATEEWVDVFTRPLYQDILLESLRFCQQNKGLIIYSWCLMTNHIHMIVGQKGEFKIEEIIRDFKKYVYPLNVLRFLDNTSDDNFNFESVGSVRKEAQALSVELTLNLPACLMRA